MKTRFYIARHYWKDKENASWQIARQFPPELLDKIKPEYSSLENKHPAYRQYNGGTVFFIYKEAEDVYGRKITEIAAATCGKPIPNPWTVTKVVFERLRNRDQNCLEIDLELGFDPYKKDSLKPPADTRKGLPSKFNILCKIATFALIVLGFLSGWFFIRHSEHNPVQTPKIESRKIQKPDQTSPDTQSGDLSSRIKPPAAKSPSKSTRKRFCNKYRGLKSVPPYIDDKCVQHYINDQCGEYIERLSYEDWLKNSVFKNRFINHCNGVNATKDKINVTNYLYEKDGINRKLSKNFFDGKK